MGPKQHKSWAQTKIKRSVTQTSKANSRWGPQAKTYVSWPYQQMWNGGGGGGEMEKKQEPTYRSFLTRFYDLVC